MKKQLLAVGTAFFLAASLTFPAIAGQWIKDSARPENQNGVSNWWYQNDDGSYPAGRWEWIDGDGDGTAECYYFSPEGWMYASTATPDGGHLVNGSGAWVVDGIIQQKTSGQGAGNQASNGQPARGWHVSEDGGRRYYTSTGVYATGWKKIDGKKYYFDETGYMLTGYQELDGEAYYFYEDGSLAKDYVHADDVYYVIDEDGRIADEVAEEDWADYRRSNGISISTKDLEGKTYERYEGLNEEMALDCIDLINAERKKAGREPLEINDSLMEAAGIRAQELVEKFSHTRPDDNSAFTVFEEVGMDGYLKAGENIAMGQSTPEAVTSAWMNSSGHKKNILTKEFTETGLGCYIDSNGRVYWAHLFYGD